MNSASAASRKKGHNTWLNAALQVTAVTMAAFETQITAAENRER